MSKKLQEDILEISKKIDLLDEDMKFFKKTRNDEFYKVAKQQRDNLLIIYKSLRDKLQEVSND